MAANLLDKVTLWTLESEFSNTEYFGKVDIRGATTLEALRFTLKSNDILDWKFDFWDAEDKRCMRKKLELLNGFSKQVHVICVGKGRSMQTRDVGLNIILFLSLLQRLVM